MLPLLLYMATSLYITSSTNPCQGNKCILCTVTGPSVIDIHGQLDFAQDRCTYTLLKTTSIPNVQVQGVFKERRRQNVTFLDSVILSLENIGVQIHLEQGGRVQLNNTLLSLNTTAQGFYDVQLSKDQAGVTAKLSHVNYTWTIFFDGYTAQIDINEPSGAAPPVEGLCGSSSSFSAARLSNGSCETKYMDNTTDSRINCIRSTERCNVLKEASFSSCHNAVKPQPYVSACAETLCSYPEIDGLDCQFLEAYSRACSLYNYHLTDWRSEENCSAEPQAFCRDRFCSTHEFCGDSTGGGTRCMCRAIFAAPYRAKNIFGDPSVCNGTKKSVLLANCLLEDKDISYNDLHLYDKSCRAEMDNVTHMVSLGFDSTSSPCGTMLRMNNKKQTVNKNAVMLETTNSEFMDLTCPFTIPEINIDFSMNIKVKSGKNKFIQYVTSGVWKYTVVMAAYLDGLRVKPLDENTLLLLNQRVWFEIKADNLNQRNVALVIHSCHATNTPEANSSLRYDLIIDSCPNPDDSSVMMGSNGRGTTTYFSFNMFRFTGKNNEVYLHCSVNLCISSCIPSCNQINRKRRFVRYVEENPVNFMMVWG